MNQSVESPRFATAHWEPDILGENFKNIEFNLGADPDGESDIVTTLVRFHPTVNDSDASRPAIVYVHGMTDYFFQTHVAEFFHEHGFDFYGVDLRKCGRSHRDGHTWHYSTDLSQYHEDLSTVCSFLAQHYSSIIVIGHSTGGLIAPVWLDELRRTNPALHDRIKALVLNSPWLDMMAPKVLVKTLTPWVKLNGKRNPKRPVRGGNLGTYGEALHVSRHGEWDFDTTFKPIGGHTKYMGWLRAVLFAQRAIHTGSVDAGVPTLSMCSHQSRLGRPYSQQSHTADTVLDVKQIKQWSPFVARNVTTVQISNGMHDLFLSEPTARAQALEQCVSWLKNTCGLPKEN
ncbi:MAG: alpha/beta hydrolase [Corynebacterium sp.]|uniref:alpha/beta hydrolase n=1 Tax=Corynebacterium sp. TaxID=1720 RepID=UPI0026DB5475|nr:alpha/beta hydrolase [Corynebacterium sp.]MDO5097992.1 alpha/beta hydrolase [Corynebacterium sp.]